MRDALVMRRSGVRFPEAAPRPGPGFWAWRRLRALLDLHNDQRHESVWTGSWTGLGLRSVSGELGKCAGPAQTR